MRKAIKEFSIKNLNKDKLKQRFNEVINNEEGSVTLEQIIWISVALVLATVIFLFREKIGEFIEKATSKVDSFEVE